MICFPLYEHMIPRGVMEGRQTWGMTCNKIPQPAKVRFMLDTLNPEVTPQIFVQWNHTRAMPPFCGIILQIFVI